MPNICRSGMSKASRWIRASPCCSRPQQLHRRRCAGTAGPWRPGDHGHAGAPHLADQRAAPCPPRRVQRTRLHERQAGSGPGRGHRRPYRGVQRAGGPQCHALLQGQFSGKIQQLVESLTRLRIYVEAAIDFPDEEIDFLSDGKVAGISTPSWTNWMRCAARPSRAPCCVKG